MWETGDWCVGVCVGVWWMVGGWVMAGMVEDRIWKWVMRGMKKVMGGGFGVYIGEKDAEEIDSFSRT